MTTTQALKILHTESSCGWGGQEIRILDEAQGMQALGHELHIVCAPQSTIYREAQQRGLAVTALPIEKKTFRGLFALLGWLRSNTFDVINTHSSTDAWLVALARLFLRTKPAVVRTRHVSAPIKPDWSSRWLYGKGCDYVVTTGERLRQHVLERTGLAENRVKSIPTGVDLQRFQVGNQQSARQYCELPQDKIIIGIVATLRSWKGHRFLLEAFAQMQKANTCLLIVGDGPGRENLKQQACDLGINDQVFMVGNQADVVPWLQSMDIFVLPSYANEGVPQSLMQAMACGLPVISTPVGSIDELVEDAVSGILVEPQSVEALLLAMNNVLQHKALAEQLSTAGRVVVQQRFSKASMLNNMQQVMRQVVM